MTSIQPIPGLAMSAAGNIQNLNLPASVGSESAAGPLTLQGMSMQSMSGAIASQNEAAGMNPVTMLLLALLMKLAGDSEEKNSDPWAILAGIAMMAQLSQGNGAVSTTSDASSYQVAATASVTSGALNVQA